MIFSIIILFFILFIIGLLFGSFLSVIIHRIHTNKKGIFFGRSTCVHCKKILKGRDLIPLVSFIINKGQCRFCKKPIGRHYFFIELFTGLMFGLLFLKFPFVQLSSLGNIIFFPDIAFIYLYYIVLSLFLIAIFFYDLLYLEIPEVFSITAIILVIVVNLLLGHPGIIEMAYGALAALLFLGLQVLISGEKWMGAGDIRVGLIMGIFFGWQLFIIALLISYVLGSFIVLILSIARIVKLKSLIPFAPFLVIGTFLTMFFGDYLLEIYLQTLL